VCFLIDFAAKVEWWKSYTPVDGKDWETPSEIDLPLSLWLDIPSL
jgi:hypothetical protein